MRKQTWLSWSSGKDSAWALQVLRQSDDYQVTGLFTTINSAFDRIAMHAVRVELLREQARAVGLPLYLLAIPYPCSDEQYAAVMADFVARARNDGVQCMAFGDLYLADVRRYREERLQGSGIEPVFPLWGRPTRELLQEMLAGGLRACLTCVDPRVLPAGFAGRELTQQLVASMPAGIDPCGENGEYHSFVFAGPMFAQPLAIEMGDVVTRDGFVFADCWLRGQGEAVPPASELRLAARHWLAECDAVGKAAGVRRLAQEWAAGAVSLDADAVLPETPGIPGQPPRPELVPPQAVTRRAMNTLAGRAAMIHAMVHIEFNAINLALDAIWRFPGMPRDYYSDWLQVADEEALHFTLLADHLQRQGYAYGDFPAHNGLWDMAMRTQHDVLARMALLPRTMEARGLDVTPGTRAKLLQAGDAAAGPILDIIMRDEIGHVAIGNRWFNHVCEQRALEPIATYARLVAEYNAAPSRGPFNLEARRAAGFSEQELALLAARS